MEDELLTARLRIRPWRPDDLAPLVAIFAKPEVWKYPFGRGWTAEETEAFLRARIEAQETAWLGPGAAADRASGQLLGYILLSVPTYLPEVMPKIEIGWRLDPAVWGRGLASEGAAALLAYAFEELGLTEVLSIYEPDNIASGRVMEHIGMHVERDTVHPFFGRPLRIYRLSRAQWEERHRGD